ncbi:hypothetical protein P7K49_007435 [Saguinus oedipus]|uniref:Uncharacterized protein n=1 Tax=Saguinus oedipus TaxID=9490 RepID=A0ABQ9VWE9_SAGOE|nr:hypothetical protein P7K49_007435 [Saguinus oedipus]
MREIVHIQAGQCGNQIGAKAPSGEGLGIASCRPSRPLCAAEGGVGSETTFADRGGTSFSAARVPGEDEGVSARLCVASGARDWDTRRIYLARLNPSRAAGGEEESDCLAIAGRVSNLKLRPFSSFASLFPCSPAPRGLPLPPAAAWGCHPCAELSHCRALAGPSTPQPLPLGASSSCSPGKRPVSTF